MLFTVFLMICSWLVRVLFGSWTSKIPPKPCWSAKTWAIKCEPLSMRETPKTRPLSSLGCLIGLPHGTLGSAWSQQPPQPRPFFTWMPHRLRGNWFDSFLLSLVVLKESMRALCSRISKIPIHGTSFWLHWISGLGDVWCWSTECWVAGRGDFT